MSVFTNMERAIAGHFRSFADVVSGSGSIAAAWLLPDGPNAAARVMVKRSYKNVAAGKSTAALQTYSFAMSTGTWTPALPMPLPSDVCMVSPSPSGRYLCVMRKDGTDASAGAGTKVKIVLDLLSAAGGLLASVTADKLHGDPTIDGWFASDLAWSPDERAMVYVAEDAAPHADARSWFDAPKPASNGGASGEVGTQYAYESREDFGEKYVSQRLPRLFMVDWWRKSVGPVTGVPNDVAAGQPVFAPDSISGGKRYMLVYTGWSIGTRRLGMIYCFNRPCALWAVDVSAQLTSKSAAEAQHWCLTAAEPISRSPVFSPNGTQLAYLGMTGTARHTHNGGSQLRILDFAAFLAHVDRHTAAAAAAAASTAASTAAAPRAAATQPPTSSPMTSLQAIRSPIPPPPAAVSSIEAIDGYLELPPSASAGSDSEKPPTYTWGAGAAAAAAADDVQPASALSWSRVVVDVVNDPHARSATSAAADAGFPGLYLQSLPSDCFSPCGNVLWLSSLRGSRHVIYRVHLPTSTVTREIDAAAIIPSSSHEASPLDASATVLAVRAAGSGDQLLMLLSATSPACPDQLGMLQCDYTPSTFVDDPNDKWKWWASTCPPSIPPVEELPGSGFEEPAATAAPNESATADAPAAQEATWSHLPSAHPSLLAAKPQVASSLSSPHALVKSCLSSLRWRLLTLRPWPKLVSGATDPHQDIEYEAICLWSEPSEPSVSLPLVVLPHGGPHSTFHTAFVLPYAFLASLGYACLMVNYRGSVGFTEASTAALPGKCGDLDVTDTFAAAVTALHLGGWAPAAEALAAAHDGSGADALPPWLKAIPQLPVKLDGSRVSVSGGSHGGFLTAHLIGQPATADLFRAAILRNPVINIASMLTATDIPDWCFTEALGCATWPVPTPTVPTERGPATTAAAAGCAVQTDYSIADGAQLSQMYACSPAAHAHRIRLLPDPSAPAPSPGSAAAIRASPSSGTAVLLTLGMKDRRVPPSQGVELYHYMKAQLAKQATETGTGAAAAAARLQHLSYPDDVHALDRVSTEGDAWVHIALHLLKHGGHKQAAAAQ